MAELPVVDLAADRSTVAAAIDRACRDVGCFYVVNHGIDAELTGSLDRLAREFFALDEGEKDEVAMRHGGRAWRGWFPLGGELTSGVPDMKEGIYFGGERPRTDRPLHGPNLFPRRPPGLRDAVLRYIDEMTALGQGVLEAMAVGLGLRPTWFRDHLTGDPLVLFRIFRYPAVRPSAEQWGVGEHTDYGLLTILGQDEHGGLQVRTKGGWIDVPPLPRTFVCNLGDMLERLTGARYRSTPHRVRNTASADRLSFPFFLDPSWESVVERLPIVHRPVDDDGAAERWDHTSVHGFTGTYGDYILGKVSKVFPELATGVVRSSRLDGDEHHPA